MVAEEVTTWLKPSACSGLTNADAGTTLISWGAPPSTGDTSLSTGAPALVCCAFTVNTIGGADTEMVGAIEGPAATFSLMTELATLVVLHVEDSTQEQRKT